MSEGADQYFDDDDNDVSGYRNDNAQVFISCYVNSSNLGDV